MDRSPFTRLTVFLLLIPAAINPTNQTEVMGGQPTMPVAISEVTSVPTPPFNTTTVAAVDTTPDQTHPQTDVTASLAYSMPGSNPLMMNPSVGKLNRSTSSPGNDSSHNEAPMSSSQPLSPTATGTAQAQRSATTSQDTSTEPGSTAATAAPSPTLVTSPEGPAETHTDISPTQSSGKSLTMLAFGVMSLILILIIIMVVLVTVVNLRDRCSNSAEEGKKSSDSVVSESNFTSIGEKESITLVSMKTIHSETDTDSPQVSSIHSTTLDYDEHELSRDLMDTKLV